MRRGEKLVLGGGVALFLATLLLPRPSCAPVALVDPVVIRVDGTTLTDWGRSAAITASLSDAAAGIVLVPRSIEDAAKIELPGAPWWWDQGLSGRRLQTVAHVVHGTRLLPAGVSSLATGQLPETLTATVTGTFAATAPDGRPALVGGTSVNAVRGDTNWPSDGRTNADVMRNLIVAGGPLELDVTDVWRLDHVRITGTAREAYVAETLTSVVAPLIAAAREQQRPVVLLSLLPGLDEQRANRWRGAFALIGTGITGVVSQPQVSSDAVTANGVARAPTMPGTLDASRLLSALGIAPPAPPAGTASGVVDRLCTSGDVSDAIELDTSLASSAGAHDQSASILLGALFLAALIAAYVVAHARRAAGARVALEVLTVAAVLLPVAATIEGAVGGGVVLRAGIGLATIAVGAALVAFTPTGRALVVAAFAGTAVCGLELARSGAEASSSIFAAPLFRAIRGEAVDAFLVAGFAVAASVLLASWIDARGTGRLARSMLGVPLAGVALLAVARGTLPAVAGVLVTIAIVAPVSTLSPRLLHRGLLLLGAGSLALGLHAAFGASLPIDGVEELVTARASAQPALWPLVAVGVVLLLLVRFRLHEHHGDVLARASFGAPAWRATEVTLLAIAPVLAFSLAAGTYAALLIAAQAVLIGRVR